MNDCTILIVLVLADRWRSNARVVVFRHRTALHHGMNVVKENLRILAKAICSGFNRWLQVHDQFSSDHIPQLSLLSYYTAYVRANRQEISHVF
jgi:hypothetical protein